MRLTSVDEDCRLVCSGLTLTAGRGNVQVAVESGLVRCRRGPRTLGMGLTSGLVPALGKVG